MVFEISFAKSIFRLPLTNNIQKTYSHSGKIHFIFIHNRKDSKSGQVRAMCSFFVKHLIKIKSTFAQSHIK